MNKADPQIKNIGIAYMLKGDNGASNTDPNAGGPWVMWKGTKYAAHHVPTAAMPKQPLAKKSVKPDTK